MPSPAEQKPMHLRLPRLAETTEGLLELVEKASPLAEERKGTFMQGEGRYGEWLLWAHTPELYDVTWRFGAELYGLVQNLRGGEVMSETQDFLYTEESKEGSNFERCVLMLLWVFTQHVDNQYVRTVMLDILTEGTSLTPQKLLFLDQPDCDIWNDDERLAMRFVEAAFTWKMTDELFAAAYESWGAEAAMSNLYLCNYYYGLAMLLSVSGCDRYVGLTADKPFREQTGWPGRDPRYPLPSRSGDTRRLGKPLTDNV